MIDVIVGTRPGAFGEVTDQSIDLNQRLHCGVRRIAIARKGSGLSIRVSGEIGTATFYPGIAIAISAQPSNHEITVHPGPLCQHVKRGELEIGKIAAWIGQNRTALVSRNMTLWRALQSRIDLAAL